MSIKFKKIKKDQSFSLNDKKEYYKRKFKLKTFLDPQGIEQRFMVDTGGHAVIIFPITKEGKIVMVNQFRPGPERVEIETPGGGIEKGEKLIEAAERELVEETGYKGNLKFLTSLYFSPYSENKKYLFLATDCEKIADIQLDDEEFLEVKLYEIDEIKELLFCGKIRNADITLMSLRELGLLG